jgi:hypothetical protein
MPGLAGQHPENRGLYIVTGALLLRTASSNFEGASSLIYKADSKNIVSAVGHCWNEIDSPKMGSCRC